MALAVGEHISGKNGALTYGLTNTVVKLTSFSIKKTASPIRSVDNSTPAGEEFLPAKRYVWSGTFEGLFRAGEAPPPFNEVISAKFTADTGITYEGDIIINDAGFTVNTENGEGVSVQRSFQGSGELTETDSTI